MSANKSRWGLCVAILAMATRLLAQPVVTTNVAPISPGLPPLPTNYVGGHIQFATNTISFGTLKSGEAVEVACIFTNTDATNPLAITDVQAGCHCTSVLDWTRRVEPGKTGRILLQYNSDQQPTMEVSRTITVATSDRLQPVAQFILVGNVWKAIDITPPYAVFEVLPDTTNGGTSLRITNNMSELIYPMPPQISNPQFAAEIKTNFPGKEYLLVVHTVGQLAPGVYSSQFTVRMSTTSAPPVTVWASARVIPAFEVKPAQILLPPGPLPGPFTTNVVIQSNSTNRGVLSEPVLELKDGTVQFRELEPGRLWLAALTVPANFRETPQTAAFTVKTSHPLAPVIRVPIYQQARSPEPPPRPSPPPQPATSPPPTSPTSGASTPSPLLRSQPSPAYVPVTTATNR